MTAGWIFAVQQNYSGQNNGIIQMSTPLMHMANPTRRLLHALVLGSGIVIALPSVAYDDGYDGGYGRYDKRPHHSDRAGGAQGKHQGGGDSVRPKQDRYKGGSYGRRGNRGYGHGNSRHGRDYGHKRGYGDRRGYYGRGGRDYGHNRGYGNHGYGNRGYGRGRGYGNNRGHGNRSYGYRGGHGARGYGYHRGIGGQRGYGRGYGRGSPSIRGGGGMRRYRR